MILEKGISYTNIIIKCSHVAVLFDAYINQTAEIYKLNISNIKVNDEAACSQIELMLLTLRLS